jgi:hypothetical protein
MSTRKIFVFIYNFVFSIDALETITVVLHITQLKHRYNSYKAMIILSLKKELYHSYKIIIYVFVYNYYKPLAWSLAQ